MLKNETTKPQDFAECKRNIIERGHKYAEQAARSRFQIANLTKSFLRDDAVSHLFSFIFKDIRNKTIVLKFNKRKKKKDNSNLNSNVFLYIYLSLFFRPF